MTPDQKIEWLISSGGLEDIATRHESYELIRKVYSHASTQARQRLIEAIRDTFGSGEEGHENSSDRDRDSL